MKITTKIDANINIKKHKLSGSCSKTLLLKKLREIYLNADSPTDMNSFWDLSCADLSSFTLDDTKEVASSVNEHWSSTGQNKVALMAPGSLTNLISTKITEQITGQASHNIKVFSHQKKAFNWLRFGQA